MPHTVLWAHSHGTGSSSKPFLAHARLVSANATVTAFRVASLFVAQISSPLRVALTGVSIISFPDTGTMIIAVFLTPPVLHVAGVSCISRFAFTGATS